MYNINTFNDIKQLFIIIFEYLFITIVKWINPLYILLTPFAYIARLCHQLPILLNVKARTLNKQSINYNKYGTLTLPSDSNFIQDRWQSFQYIEWKLSEYMAIDKLKVIFDDWSMKNFKCKSNFIENEGNVKEYIETITRKKPSEVIINTTHLIVYSKNSVSIFMDHYFCDGLIVADLLKVISYEDNISTITFPKYKSYPLISDYCAIEYLVRMFHENIKYPPLINGIGAKTHLMTEIVKKNEQLPWNRWTIYAHGIYNIYEALPEDVDYLRIGLTVGFDTDTTFGNNRIGLIIVIIKKPPANLIYNEKILNYMEQFKNQTLARYRDANTSYDIIRSYNMSYVRSSKMTRLVDIYFTSFYFKEEARNFIGGIGGFVGTLNNTENVYICATSFGSTTYFTYLSNWKQLNLNKLTSNGLTMEYEFDNNDPNQY